ncbi:xyloglucan endotransglucosylase/hydrolase protein 31-like [Phragmites australis]|uniref:xyloglucan endotransglucosylase/hydrolase protein 31-like n=1 Tax=Phragmites australis TaxID=29695 RepID=UPI002D770064|nr:xyloglucan endotransglucosylase/hydrolase protein 31-like [Phragmites australis]
MEKARAWRGGCRGSGPTKTHPLVDASAQLHLHSSSHHLPGFQLSIMAFGSESGDAVPHPHHRHGTETLAHIAVDYCPEACRHVPHAGEIHVTYDDRGGARWRSRRRYLPGGAVTATIRAPDGDTAGLNYNLYLSSLEGSPDMDEIDFEFLGHDKCAVQTNFHVEGGGGREQIHRLPFDSSDDFHHYAIAWDDKAIEWRVDGELIRREERCEGEPWPVKPMFLYASVWDASHIDEGRWTGTYHGRDAPYVCSYRDVRVPPIALSVEEEEECQDADAGDAPTEAAAAATAAAVEAVDAGGSKA